MATTAKQLADGKALGKKCIIVSIIIITRGSTTIKQYVRGEVLLFFFFFLARAWRFAMCNSLGVTARYIIVECRGGASRYMDLVWPSVAPETFFGILRASEPNSRPILIAWA